MKKLHPDLNIILDIDSFIIYYESDGALSVIETTQIASVSSL